MLCGCVGWLLRLSIIYLVEEHCDSALGLQNSVLVPLARQNIASARLVRAGEEICLERNAKGGLGLALPRGKRRGATFLRGEHIFLLFKGKINCLHLLANYTSVINCFFSNKAYSDAQWPC